MQIHGFQKMTMLDFPGRVACTVFTAGCNLRCPFCHNARLVTHKESCDRIEEQEIFDYLEKRKGILDGVCITGGEPLLQPDIAEFMKNIKKLGLEIKLDTNGCFPDRLKALVNDGLVDYVAMDIKNSPELYGKTVGIEDFDISPISESIKLLTQGKISYEFRMTVVRELHTLQSITKASEWIAGAKQFFLQSFVDSGDLIGEGLSAPETDFMKQAQCAAAAFVEKVELRGI